MCILEWVKLEVPSADVPGTKQGPLGAGVAQGAPQDG